ncbi:MAG TPA: enoyl-CoA hydratase/isomerase family protein [Candidimonas sp.]|nr:enoyl-CoA hydratase/isomerase family protein [Candidimonas sp.]
MPVTVQAFTPHLVRITLNRPEKRNSLSLEIVEKLIAAFSDAEGSGARAVVFTGSGKNFSAGFDFEAYESQSEGDLLWRFVRIETLLQKIANSRLLTAAFAHGRNFGAGADIFAACKLRIAAPESTFVFPGIKFGLVLGTNRLAGLTGRDRARVILETGEVLSAPQALHDKLANAVVDVADWDARIAQLGEQVRPDTHTYLELLYSALSPESTAHTDMSLLARSAAEPGIKQRIAAYLK